MEPKVGMVIYGYCNGFFGRDSYEPKRIEAIGCDWIVARPLDAAAKAEIANFDSYEELLSYVDKWSRKEE